MIYMGSKGMLLQNDQGGNVRFFPEELSDNLPEVPEQFPRIADQSHEMNWIRAIQGTEEATSPFSFAAPLLIEKTRQSSKTRAKIIRRVRVERTAKVTRRNLLRSGFSIYATNLD